LQSHWFDAGLFLVARMKITEEIFTAYCFVGSSVNKT